MTRSRTLSRTLGVRRPATRSPGRVSHRPWPPVVTIRDRRDRDCLSGPPAAPAPGLGLRRPLRLSAAAAAAPAESLSHGGRSDRP